MSQGVKVDLPKVEAPTMEQQKLLKVSITKNLEIFIADMQVDMESFESIFKSLCRDASAKTGREKTRFFDDDS